jgi:hypothetical protein
MIGFPFFALPTEAGLLFFPFLSFPFVLPVFVYFANYFT